MSARYEIDGDVAEIVIDKPPLNLWGAELIADVEEGVARAAAERARACSSGWSRRWSGSRR